jgi:hypothetical protein
MGRGKMRRCSHVDRKTGVRCSAKVKAPKRRLRVFCKRHKINHHPKNKTSIIVRKNNSVNSSLRRGDNNGKNKTDNDSI